MKIVYSIVSTIFFVFAMHAATFAQATNISESLKKHFNETVQDVRNTDNSDEKREILNTSFNKMIVAIDRVESLASLNEDQRAALKSYRKGLTEKVNELNGINGFDRVMDEDIKDFTSYSQNYIEQANSTITIGVTTALLILIILLIL